MHQDRAYHLTNLHQPTLLGQTHVYREGRYASTVGAVQLHRKADLSQVLLLYQVWSLVQLPTSTTLWVAINVSEGRGSEMSGPGE